MRHITPVKSCVSYCCLWRNGCLNSKVMSTMSDSPFASTRQCQLQQAHALSTPGSCMSRSRDGDGRALWASKPSNLRCTCVNGVIGRANQMSQCQIHFALVHAMPSPGAVLQLHATALSPSSPPGTCRACSRTFRAHGVNNNVVAGPSCVLVRWEADGGDGCWWCLCAARVDEGVEEGKVVLGEFALWS